MYSYGLIGNCQISALINKTGSMDWLCLPRPDSPPVFGKILDPDGGHFKINPVGPHYTTQEYISNTNILITHFYCEDGSKFSITDFCPRFEIYNRKFRPCSLFRILEVTHGNPLISVDFRPIDGWDKKHPKFIRGNSHIRYKIRGENLRLTTNMPMTFLLDKAEFSPNKKIYFALTWNHAIEDDLATLTNHYLEKTIQYWRTWVKHCSIPKLFQNETIRSALALKLHCFEDTGAIFAALTTSLPEECGHERNWDYRFCWLRDAAFILSAFHHLGHFEEMEGFLQYLLNIANTIAHNKDRLRPVYGLDLTIPLPEKSHPAWAGFENSKPVRSNNQAAEHSQYDVYGEMILTLSPIFSDERLKHLRTKEVENLITDFCANCITHLDVPDAGLWEIRGGWQVHSFSNLMCWAGIDRTIAIHKQGYLPNLDLNYLLSAKAKAEKSLERAVIEGSLRNGPKDDSLDASLLLISMLRYPDEKLSEKTVMDIYERLQIKTTENVNTGFLYRYLRPDDFGMPQSSFMICSFWLAMALVKIGNQELAQEVMNKVITSSNHLGLFSEHYVPHTKTQLGNFPQAYSHVGLINAAFLVSPPWDIFI